MPRSGDDGELKREPGTTYRIIELSGHDERFVRANVARLTRKHEASQALPWKMTDAPADYIDEMLKKIVGLEIEITRLVGKAKLSQNKEVRDIRNAGEILSAQGDEVIGEAMLAAAAGKAERG